MMKEQLILQKRDIELLHFLALYRHIRLKDVKNIYETSIYYLRRIEKLSKYKYIVRSKKKVYLGKTGKNYLEENNITTKDWCRNDTNISRIERISNIAGAFYNYKYKFVPRIYTKIGRKYVGQLINKEANKVYIVYYLPDNINRKLSKTIQKDIQKENQENSILIFYDSEQSALSYGLQSYGFKELVLMQFTEDNIKLFKEYNTTRIKELLENELKVNLQPSLWQGADYFIEENNNYIAVLLLHDIRKIQEILQYFKVNINSSRKIIVFCFTKDKARYEKLLPMCEIEEIKFKEDLKL